jgi:hypothetical protein
MWLGIVPAGSDFGFGGDFDLVKRGGADLWKGLACAVIRLRKAHIPHLQH